MVSLIITVKNEKSNLPLWLDSILAQIVLPDEIVIVDGGSSDGTWEYLLTQVANHKNLRIFQHAGNIASGRNFAINQSHGEIIVVADAGCVYDKFWLEKITTPFKSGARWSATGFAPWLLDADGILVRLIAAATIPGEREFDKDWLPSSRSVAFYRDLWQDVGGYPEWIPICEDVIFDRKIIDLAGKPAYVREALVRWRPRASLAAYFKQLFRYTRSDGHGQLWLSRQLTRYVVYGSSLILLYLTLNAVWYWAIVLLAGIIVYIKKFWLRWLEFSRSLPWLCKVLGIILLPAVVAWGDLAKMCGWPVGVWERWTRKIRHQ